VRNSGEKNNNQFVDDLASKIVQEEVIISKNWSKRSSK
jgi:hypothetical protein